MKKMFLTGVLLLCGLMSFTAGAWGQTNIDPELAAAFSREAPLTRHDLDVYLKALPLLNGSGSGAAAVFEEAGFSEIRGIYVVIKAVQAYTVVEFERRLGAEAAESYRNSLEEAIRPTPEEVGLIRRNKDRIDAAARAF